MITQNISSPSLPTLPSLIITLSPALQPQICILQHQLIYFQQRNQKIRKTCQNVKSASSKTKAHLKNHLPHICAAYWNYDEYELKLVFTSKGFRASNLFIQRHMSEPKEKHGSKSPLLNPSGKQSSAETALHPNIPGIIIEITNQKKKAEVIEINDSEEDKVHPAKPQRKKETKRQAKPEKTKLLSKSCRLCKAPGKKNRMKGCISCSRFFHIDCIEQEGQQVAHYQCAKCKHNKKEGKTAAGTSKKSEKTEKNQEKLAGKRLEKEKKREEQTKLLAAFQERYPYYFQDDRIRFPIEDKLLFIHRELFQVSETSKPKPQPHPIIPPSLLGDYLQLQNFFSTFRDELRAYGSVPTQIRKNIFYLSMNSEGMDIIFCNILECLLKLYLSDIFDKNKTDNVRILNEHPFFTLMIHLNDNEELSQEVIVRAASEIIRYLATIPSMKRAFEGLNFPEEYVLSGKKDLLIGLIKGLSEVDQFHTLVSIKSERMQQLTKERTELVAKLKVDEAESLTNNEKLKDMAIAGKEMELSPEGGTKTSIKQIDKHKKKIQKLASEKTKSEETIKEIRAKISEIGRAMPFLTSKVFFLGIDRNNAEYFFYVREPNRIYVKHRGYLLDRNENFMMYEGKQVINELMKQFNIKGIHQRHLYEIIQSFIKDQIIVNHIPADDGSLFNFEEKYMSITLMQVLNMVKQVEETFTLYLDVKQCQWSAPHIREMFMKQFMCLDDLQTVKEQLRSLQENFLFAQYINSESINNVNNRDLDSDEEIKNDYRQGREGGRRKVPIRIWGINSEKTKRYWLEYLEQCIDVVGIWICAVIFKSNVDKYVKKKMEAYYNQQLKEQKYKAKQVKQRGRNLIKQSERQRYQERYQEKKVSISSSSSQEEEEQEQIYEGKESRRPNLRKRRIKKMNLESQDVEIEQEDEKMDIQDQQEDEQSSNEECCQVCGQYGEMLCCDTCPKVYHVECLKIKDVPEGQWSCYKCLQKLSRERQTRSRIKKMGKYV